MIVRITSDCPLISPYILDEMANLIFNNNYDIITNVLPPSWPDGLDLNIFNKKYFLRLVIMPFLKVIKNM